MKVYDWKLKGLKLVKKPSDLQSDRIRFNWGYHDGAQDITLFTERQCKEFESRHFDPVYADGHVQGRDDKRTNQYTHNSEKAWKESGYKENGFSNHVVPIEPFGPIGIYQA